MKIKLPKSTIFTVLMLLLSCVMFAQSAGDYRSAGNGNWTDRNSWERFNVPGGWLTPTAAQGYPGQNVGTGAVLIQAGNTITIGTSALTTQSMGTLTISGSLVLKGIGTGSNGTDFLLNTNKVIVTSGLNPAANINFQDKVDLKLPSNSSLEVSIGGLEGDCSNNQDIYIGSNVYSYCKGGESVLPTFSDLMINGGSLTATPSSNSPVCQNNTINLNGNYSGFSGKKTSGGSDGVNYSWSIVLAPAGTITDSTSKDASITNVSAGTYQIQLTCSTYYGTNLYANSKTISVVVNDLPSTPAAEIVTQPTCSVPTGSFMITNYNVSYTYTFSPSTGVIVNADKVTAPPGTYTFTAFNGNCMSTASANVVINNPPDTKRWNGTAWQKWNGTIWVSTGNPTIDNPTIENPIIFTGNYDSIVDIDGCSCLVNAGVHVKIASGKTLKLQNELVVNGTLTFEDTANLVQINSSAANSGNITYKRTATGIKVNDYIYWSTPVGGQILGDFSPSTKYLWNTDVSNWRVPVAGDMVLGRGYIIRRSIAGDFTGSFTGTPNNGAVSIAIGSSGTFNLIGNPYPSAIDADKFLNHNSAVLGGTIYFWTHITAITERENLEQGTAGSGNLAYTSNDYASYNVSGGVATKAKSDKTTDADNKYKPTGKIAAGQAFFATSRATGESAKFKNEMRHDAAIKPYNNTQFFKIKANSKTNSTIEKNRVWLNLTNAGGAFKQTLIGYITGATNEYDNVYDGVSFNANAFIDFYSINKDKNLVIQGRALPFEDNDKVPLGYKTTIVGEFKIAIDEVDGFLTGKKIILEDRLLNKIQDLSEAAYTFTTQKGTFNDRFVLSYANKTLATEDFEAVENKVVITNKNREVKISTPENEIDAVSIYDVSGRQIYSKSKVDKNELMITTLIARDQVLIVKVVMKDKSIVTKKTIY
ncbi:T9SS sorting signal type C domain-containing protein [Flavobacterium hiemivividum]|uniref:T9SS sorting signal type C domain-containing protein n=1 Tax=Flavobacterium hiemivividum TaxID=2541734 RepID=A0A4R5D5Y6_9FLAO|nr:T9SS sorting signal type C domain-containing protein [Flavobacterium hiemivividum]TDE06674.1 T9SS sorting signal type C domain-containing protein [Flavobacterium hiemivividum]